MYEWFERFRRCRVSTQWTIPRSQSTSVASTLSWSKGLPSRNNQPPDIWNPQGISGNVFENPRASSSSPYPGGFNPWMSNVSEDPPVLTSTGRGADQQRLQISDLHFDKCPDPGTFACWEIRFKTEVCTCSQFPTEAVLWIKEVEMVEAVDDLKSSRSIKGTPGPNFWVTWRENCFSTEQNHP